MDNNDFEVVEQFRQHFDEKTDENEFACLDYLLKGEPLTEELYDKAIRQPLIDNLQLTRDSRVLDVGCGTGLVLRSIEDHCEKCVGVDISQNLLDKYKGKAEVFVSAAHELPFEDKSFDRIYMVSVSILFPSFEYFKQVVDRCLTLLDDGGIFVISDQIVGRYQGKSKYLAIDPNELVDFLESLSLPYSLLAQNQLKRSFSVRRDIIIYK